MDRRKYEAIFQRESNSYLDDLDQLLARVEAELSGAGIWSEIHGKVHSIKGMARALEVDPVMHLAHGMEDWCKAFQTADLRAVPKEIDLLSSGAEMLRVLVNAVGLPEDDDISNRYQELRRAFAAFPRTDGEKDQSGTRASRRPSVSPPPKEEAPSIDEVRVRYGLIEELLGLSQEIQLLEKTLPPLPDAEPGHAIHAWLGHYTALMKELYFRLAQLRLMPVEDFVSLYTKTVRKLAREHGKRCRVEVTGGEIYADITLLERLREALVHLIRNGIAHGIEPPEERTAAGKEPQGLLSVVVDRKKERLLLEIRDDGRGIDRDKLREYLKSRDGISDAQAGQLPDSRLFGVLFDPAFSSSSEADDLAGRGIGMYVVHQTVENLGGSLSVSSESGKGTSFAISLPLSLSILYGVAFRIGRYALAVPTSEVESIQRPDQLKPAERERLVSLHAAFGQGEPKGNDTRVVRLKTGGRIPTAGFAVDRISGNKPLLILPLGELLARSHIYSGVGVRDNGSLVMVLDIEQLPRFRDGRSM